MGTNRGFTLIELMVTLSIVVIITIMAAPSFGNMMTRQKLDTSARDFMAVLNQGRSQATVLRSTVAVCPSKLATDANFTKDKCAQAAIPEYTATSGLPPVASLTPAQKAEILNNRVFLVDLDPKINVESTSASFILFNATGGIAAEKNFKICSSGNKYSITITRLGNLTQAKSTGVCI
ncbi:GspH/FimT family pseudopilin [Acinetobacter tjernbergiae]|uniref:Type II secretion system protein H n=1 Tax=Acinetobacter tjernbergiae DSM 14971 = CIP 107465 TaxID=1120928 RepID=V2UWM9_9GAMM|nr:GspH/FimT family pseudopilin [Acinetobacter tjernbergiae]ESK54392.1 hypothetical protein F990_02751 [Acinetobacter tjernbergiae DSM 14971 = CIP 107465]MBH2029841.1 GspH/FimT family pseudopilin [Moraxellaceae bacterium]